MLGVIEFLSLDDVMQGPALRTRLESAPNAFPTHNPARVPGRSRIWIR
jgi:hypothetical protein